MNPELERLLQIVQKDGFTADDRQYVLDLKQQLQDLTATEKLAQHPTIKAYLDFLEQEITSCKDLLSDEHQRLDEKARDRLFERIRQCKEMRSMFQVQETKDGLEFQIKGTLEEA